MRRHVLLNIVRTNRDGLVEDVKAGGSLSCSDHEIVVFRILRGGRRAKNKIKTLDFRRANFGFFKDLLGGISWVSALEVRGIQESWLMFKHHFIHAQDRYIPTSKKSSKGCRVPAWMSEELLAKLKWK